MTAHAGAAALACRRAGSSPSKLPDSIEEAVSAMKWPCSAGSTAVPMFTFTRCTGPQAAGGAQEPYPRVKAQRSGCLRSKHACEFTQHV
jgi:hypothetical protein